MNTRLKQERLKQNLTQQQVAKAVGIHVRTYRNIETCKKQTKINIALAIAKLLNSTAEELFTDE